jgi:hypothetical protein
MFPKAIASISYIASTVYVTRRCQTTIKFLYATNLVAAKCHLAVVLLHFLTNPKYAHGNRVYVYY